MARYCDEYLGSIDNIHPETMHPQTDRQIDTKYTERQRQTHTYM